MSAPAGVMLLTGVALTGLARLGCAARVLSASATTNHNRDRSGRGADPRGHTAGNGEQRLTGCE